MAADDPAGETDLRLMLETLETRRRPGRFVVVTLPDSPAVHADVDVLLREDEGTTVICRAEVADRNGWTYEFVASWLTLTVHSSLEAVGLTAAVAAALADIDMPCNVLAGYYHDHLLVPHERADEASAALRTLGERRTSSA